MRKNEVLNNSFNKYGHASNDSGALGTLTFRNNDNNNLSKGMSSRDFVAIKINNINQPADIH